MGFNRTVVLLAVNCLVVAAVSPLLITTSGYEITRFPDETAEKTLLFTADVGQGTVFLNIPRATNLSQATLMLEAASSTIDQTLRFDQFQDGTAKNLSGDGQGLQIAPKANWWNGSWHYRVPVSVNAGSKARHDVAVEAQVNFSRLMLDMGLAGAVFDEMSPRVIEYDGNMMPKPYNSSLEGTEKFEVPIQASNANGNRTNYYNFRVCWLLGGDTPSQAERTFFLYFDDMEHGPKPKSRVTLDFWNDVLFANSDPRENFGTLYSNDKGSFTKSPAVLFPTHAASALAVGDLNGDGYRDIVFPNWYNGSSYRIDSFIYPGSPSGFDNATPWLLYTCGTAGCAVGDVNSDGIDDVVFAGYRVSLNYTVGSRLYLGGLTGPQNLTPTFFYTEGAIDAVIADVNNDGLRDIIFANSRTISTGNVNSSIYLNNGGMFNSTPDILLPTQNANGVEVADLNKDGWLDIVFANNQNTSIPDSTKYDIDSFIYYGSPAGYNATPDVRLSTHGALDLKIGDLNNDGWLDIIFANYNDGATSNTLSAAYFGGPNGIITTPRAFFQTSWASGVDIGEVNNDGYLDVAFANYYDGATTAISSTIFFGPCIGLQQPGILLPTEGAGDVKISDVDTYHMASDKDPPVLTFGGPDGLYIPDGTYTSKAVAVDERILSASAVWNATLPATPAGCAVNVSLSNDAGATWARVQPGTLLNFTSTGKSLRYKVELFSDPLGVGTPVFQDITISYTKESYPFNVTLDVNSDGRSEWTYPGRFNGTAVLNETTMGLRTLLEEVVPRTGTGNFQVSLKFASEKPGILRLFGLNITGNYRPEVIQELPDFVMTENIPLPNAFNVKNYFRHLDDDPLQYSTRGNRNVLLNISENGSVNISTTPNWYGAESFLLRATDDAGEWAEVAVNVEVRHVLQPPRFVAAMPDITVDEGDTVFSAFNLLEYVFDPDNPKTSLIFSVADVSNPNVSVSMDINDNIEVRSKAGWDGTAVVKIKVSDGELSAIASFNVTVVRHNRPPVIAQLPPVQLEQDGTLDRSFNLLNFTTDSDTPRQNLTFKIDDNTNPNSGVSVSPDGWVSIRPARGWSGTALVVVNVSDGEFGVRASFTVTVTPKAVTPPPTTTTDNTLMYILIALVVVMMAFVAVDIGLRFRKPGQPAPPAQPPEAARPAAVVKKVKVHPVAPQHAGTTEEATAPPAPAEAPPIDVQAAATAPDQPPAPAEAPPEMPAGQPEAPPAPGYEFSQVEQAPQPQAGDMAPVPSTPEAPPGTVPDMTPDAGAPGPDGTHAEPETMDMDSQAPAGTPEPAQTAEAPAPEIGAGEVEQRPAASAASLLQALQKPVPRLETEAEQPPAPSAEAPAPTPADAGERFEAALMSKATESEHAPAEIEQKDVKPITRVRCAGCKAAIPIFSAQRPLVVTCPQCGRMGMLK